MSENGSSKKKQVSIYLEAADMAAIKEYALKHGILATTGCNAGEPHISKVVQIAIAQLATSGG